MSRTTLGRSDFARELASGGGALNVNDLEPQTIAALTAAGVSKADLTRIAGKDGQISGKEFQNLFDVLETAEHDAGRANLTLADDRGHVTLTGEAVADLRAEIDRHRQMASNRGIIHLGMRDSSSSEVAALRQVTPGEVHAIRATQDNVEIDGKRFDLRTEAGVAAFLEALVTGSTGMDAERALRFGNLLVVAEPAVRDELAALGVALFKVGDGRLPANRLVLSGHGDGTALYGDRTADMIDHKVLLELGRLFPEGARGIEHIAFSSCFSGTSQSGWAELRDVFPNVKNILGYAEFSPSAEKGSPRDLRAWAQKTDGDDSSQLDPTGRNIATWNKADGNQHVPQLSVKACEAIGKQAAQAIEAFKRRGGNGATDGQLREAYIAVAQAVNAEGLSPSLRSELYAAKRELYNLRHP